MRGDLCNLTDAQGHLSISTKFVPTAPVPFLPRVKPQCDQATSSRAKVPADCVTARSSGIFQHVCDVPNSSTEDLPQCAARVVLSRCTTGQAGSAGVPRDCTAVSCSAQFGTHLLPFGIINILKPQPKHQTRLLHPISPSISENYADIKARIQAACLKLSELGELNIAVIAPNYFMPEG